MAYSSGRHLSSLAKLALLLRQRGCATFQHDKQTLEFYEIDVSEHYLIKVSPEEDELMDVIYLPGNHNPMTL